MSANERLSLIALSHVLFLTPRERLILTQVMGDARAVLSLSVTDLSQVLGRRVVTRSWDPPALLARAAERIAAAFA